MKRKTAMRVARVLEWVGYCMVGVATVALIAGAVKAGGLLGG